MTNGVPCKYCETQMEIEYRNLESQVGTIVATCPKCGAIGSSECKSELLKSPKNSLRFKNTQLVFTATLQAAENSKIE